MDHRLLVSIYLVACCAAVNLASCSSSTSKFLFELISLLILLLFFFLFFFLGRPMPKAPKLRRFKSDQDEIWQDCSSGIGLNTGGRAATVAGLWLNLRVWLSINWHQTQSHSIVCVSPSVSVRVDALVSNFFIMSVHYIN